VSSGDLFPPSELGLWRELTEAGRQQWLLNARDRFFAQASGEQPAGQRPENVPPDHRVFTIDGADIVDFSSFLCAIGEAVNGPGGYFGRNWDAFDDCLFGGFGLEAPCKIVWKNAVLSRQRLGAAALARRCEEGLERIAEEEQPELFEEGRAWCVETLELARRGERTLFDELIDTIESVPARFLSRPDWVIAIILE
jgi:RNAse (barnase) inhibitor barstar